MSQSERIADIEFKLRNKLITPWEVMYQENPDGFENIEAAFEKFVENQNKSRKVDELLMTKKASTKQLE